MPVSEMLRRAAAMAACAAAVTTLAGLPPASAAPVFTDANTLLHPFGNYENNGPNCTVAGVADAGSNVPVVENGPAASVTANASATYGNTATPSDTGSWTAQVTA